MNIRDVLLFISLLFASSSIFANECLVEPETLLWGAVYSTTTIGPQHNNTELWRYWRDENKVAYEYPERGFSEIWYKNKNNHISFDRWFNLKRRIISYENGDLRSVGKNLNWNQVSQLIAGHDLEQLKPVGETHYRCLTVSRLKGTRKNGDIIEVLKQTSSNRVIEIKISSGRRSILTQLQEFSGAKSVNEFFNSASDYYSTDFSDIGDNEADPFLSKLIAMGFIEHREEQNGVRYPGHHH